MTTTCAVEVSFREQTSAGQVEMAELESQMLSHLLKGDTRRAILSYHDTMVVAVNEAKAVVRVLANMHGIRLRRI